MRPIAEIVVHCAATKPSWMVGKPINQVIDEIRRWHVDGNGWSDIGYHYVIDRAGNVGLGRPVARTGAHTRGHNTGTIGVCLLGGHGSAATDNFSDHFTDEQDTALRDLIKTLRKEYPRLAKISGHNEYAAKACPGFRVQPWLHSAPSMAPPAVEIPPQGLWARIVAAFFGKTKR